jgi:predicted transcriptional regulator
MLYGKEDFTVHKLIILYLLSEIKMPLSLSQLTEIILERGYTDYFSLQQYLSELQEAGLLILSKENNSSHFQLSERGKQTLEFFVTRIPSSIRTELDYFINANWRKLRNERDILAEYLPLKEHEYLVHCKIVEQNSVLVDLSVNVSSKKQAIRMCEKFKKDSAIIYEQIINLLSTEKNKDKIKSQPPV